MLRGCLSNYLRVMDPGAMARFYSITRTEEDHAMFMLKSSFRLKVK